jgi:adenylate kinase family enzyme
VTKFGENVGRLRDDCCREPLAAVVALSGPVGAGKTTLASGLERAVDGIVVSTRELLRQQAPTENRAGLQQLGEELDALRGGEWVAQPVLARRRELPATQLIIVDAVRTGDQVTALRVEAQVCHIHLTAPEPLLRERYEARYREAPDFELPSFSALRANSTEAASDALAGLADLVLDTGQLSIDDTREAAIRVLRYTGETS